MPKPMPLACALASLLLISGCQSRSTQPMQISATECHPPPPPEAWYMHPRVPDLTQRMLNELSASPATAMKD